MRLTPIDLLNQRFRRVLRGYAPGAVDDFLREIEVEYEAMFAENARLTEKVDSLQREVDRYLAMEETLKRALVLAEKTAGETCESARREAARMIGEAQEKAASMQESAEREVDEARRKRARFARDFRCLLQAYLDGIEIDPAHPDAEQTRSGNGES